MAALLQTTNYISLNENWFILIQISQKFVPNGSIENKSALVRVMAYHWSGDKPYPEPVEAKFSKYMITWPQCVNELVLRDVL